MQRITTFREYIAAAASFDIYPTQMAHVYPELGLIEEIGEFAGKIKKMIRDDGCTLTAERKEAIAYELGDILWYCAAYQRQHFPEAMAKRDISIGSIRRRIKMHEDQIEDRFSLEKIPYKMMLFVTHLNSIDGLYFLVSLVDIAAYLIGYTLEEVANMNIAKLTDRKNRDAIKGSGDNR